MPNEKKDGPVDSPARWALGWLLLAASVFLLLSVLSYDWRDVGWLHEPRPQAAAANLIGPAGALSAFALFMTLGVGAYLAPVTLAGIGVVLLTDRQRRVWPRALWLLAALLGLTLATELQRDWWTGLCANLNIEDGGGLLGHELMRGLLMRGLGRTGAGILVGLLITAALAFGLEGRRIAAAWRQAGAAWTALRARMTERARRADEEHEREARAGKARLKEEAEAARKAAAGREAGPTEAGAQPASVRAARKAPPPAPEPEPEPEPAERNGAAPPSLPTDYQLPPLDLLEATPPAPPDTGQEDSNATAAKIVATLSHFDITVEVTNIERGPVVTRYEVTPAPGIRVERIGQLHSNLALELKATSVRVQAPVPGKGVVGIEVPNATARMVTLREIMEGRAWLKHRDSLRLPLLLGKDVGGADIIADLARMPHLLIAGATGSGKTVCMNAILTGLLMARSPAELRLVLVDPKIVEFSVFNRLPHLAMPVVTDPRKVSLALRWAIAEMEKRYKLFNRAAVRNIESFNSRVIAQQADLFQPPPRLDDEDMPARLPYVVVVVDELNDLMLTARAEVENSIARLAQLSRAVGIHMILATQRPSVNVITGTIKANFPARIAFQVAQNNDSRTILDSGGAEKLLGRGDMLFLPPSTGKLLRGQGAMVRDNEVAAIVEFICRQAPPAYETRITEEIEKAAAEGEGEAEDVSDDLLPQAIEIIRETRRASTSALQRRLRIGYNRAGRLMDVLEQKGIVGPPRGSDPREILIDLDGDIPNNPSDSGAADDSGGVLPEDTGSGDERGQ
jgi:S-DNA-T family DNA segregation ATPase FtsK/SpoIIIE